MQQLLLSTEESLFWSLIISIQLCTHDDDDDKNEEDDDNEDEDANNNDDVEVQAVCALFGSTRPLCPGHDQSVTCRHHPDDRHHHYDHDYDDHHHPDHHWGG